MEEKLKVCFCFESWTVEAEGATLEPLIAENCKICQISVKKKKKKIAK
jgi:hypothetical protein